MGQTKQSLSATRSTDHREGIIGLREICKARDKTAEDIENFEARLTWQVRLPGGQKRLREMVVFVSVECASAEYFGLIKLNKIIWRADFQAFAKRGVPVTGRQYQRLPKGPAAIEMLPVLNELQSEGAIQLEERIVIDYSAKHPVPLVRPNLRLFSEDDMHYVREAIKHHWTMTGTETSDESHGMAWKTREDGMPMPYEFIFLSNTPIDSEQRRKLLELAAERGWHSQ